MTKKLVIFGTRPEFIKLLPVIEEINHQGLKKKFIFLFTGQHTELITELFTDFGFTPDIIIGPKNHHNSLVFSFTQILADIQEVADKIQNTHLIEMVIGQGDTTSCVCAAIYAFLNKIPFAHIEAGLRTSDYASPYPEEFFRKIISCASTIHFAPTQMAKENLIKEGINEDNIIITGNTIVDTVALIKKRSLARSSTQFFSEPLQNLDNIVLITYHRRENQNGNLRVFMDTVATLAKEYPTRNFVWVQHKSPFLQNTNFPEFFKGVKNMHVIPPLNTSELYNLYNRTKIIITDSGGIQEEAPSFNIPVIVIRNKTERMESVEKGYSILVENFEDELEKVFEGLIKRRILPMKNPYGDGNAAQRIVDYLKR